jgi:hypothetical protein
MIHDHAIREIPGALERPADSRVEILTLDDATVTLAIPRPEIPWFMIAFLTGSSLALTGAFVLGLSVFVFNLDTPLLHDLIGVDMRGAPVSGRIVAITGWLMMLAVGAVSIFVAVRPMTRREQVVFAPQELLHREQTFGRWRTSRYAYVDVVEFRDRRDRQGMVESSLVMRVAGQDATWADDVPVALSTTEAEKQWLTSVLNVLLTQFRPKGETRGG